MTSFTHQLERACLHNPGNPRLTWYGPGGARIELSGANLYQWVAKMGNALVEEADVEPGDLVQVQLPLHYLTIVSTCALWSVGAALSTDADGPLICNQAPDGVREPGNLVLGLNLTPLARDLPAQATWSDVDLLAATISSADAPLYAADDTPHAPDVSANSRIGERLLVQQPHAESDELIHWAEIICGGGSLVLVSDPAMDCTQVRATEGISGTYTP